MKFEIIPVDEIRPAEWQPRDTFPKETIGELATSIKGVGLIEPIVVRKKGKTFQIIAGERRWRAHQSAGFDKIPCIIREEEDTEAKIISAVENWHREQVGTIQNEKFLAELYEEGLEKRRWKSIKDMANRTGISRLTLNKIITAYKERKEIDIDTTITYQDLDRTRGLKENPEIRERLLKKRAEGKIIATDLTEYSKTLKEAPEPLAEAIVEDKVDFEDAKPLIEHGIPEELVQPTIEELTDRKKEREEIRELERETDLAMVKGEIKAKGIRVEDSPDYKRLKKYEEMRDIVCWWSVSSVKMIKNEELRKSAIDCIRRIEDHCRNLLHQLGEIEIKDMEELQE